MELGAQEFRSLLQTNLNMSFLECMDELSWLDVVEAELAESTLSADDFILKLKLLNKAFNGDFGGLGTAVADVVVEFEITARRRVLGEL